MIQMEIVMSPKPVWFIACGLRFITSKVLDIFKGRFKFHHSFISIHSIQIFIRFFLCGWHSRNNTRKNNPGLCLHGAQSAGDPIFHTFIHHHVSGTVLC